jgi:hypothetical protein
VDLQDLFLIGGSLILLYLIAKWSDQAGCTYQDSFISLAMARYFTEPTPTIFSRYFRSRSLDDHFPPTFVHPVLLRLFLLMSFQRAVIALSLSTVYGTALSVYIFRRVLLTFDVVHNPTLTTALFCVAPMHWTLLRSAAVGDSWEICFLCLALISFGTDRFFFLLLSLFLAASTRIESFILYPIFTILYALRRRKWCCLGIGLFGFIHGIAIGYVSPEARDFGGYICAPYAYTGQSVGRSLIHNFINLGMSIDYLRKIHGFVALLAPSLIGAIALVQKCAPIGLVAGAWILFASFFSGGELYRLLVPGEIFALLIGWDDIFTTPMIQRITWGFLFVYAGFDIAYAKSEMPKLAFSPEAWRELVSDFHR